MKIYKDPIFGFYEFFNEKTGFLIRTDINKSDKKIKPFKRSYPELIDIGIMGHCKNKKTCKENGILCYQKYLSEDNMAYEDYCDIINQSKGRTFQVALGGRGDPNKHEFFEELLKYTVDNGIVPNLTTSGYDITQHEINLIKKYCGAVAISCYSRIIDNKETNPNFQNVVDSLSKDIITNIHFVITNVTIVDAILRLKYDLFPENINAVIFLLHKPVGEAINCCSSLSINKDKMDEFFELALKKRHSFKIGFDSCFSNIVSNYYDEYDNIECLQCCESGRFSCYIDHNLKMYPCSFAQKDLFACDLTKITIQDAWFSKEFKAFVNLNKGHLLLCPLRFNELKKNI